MWIRPACSGAKERHAQAAELPEFTHYQEMLEQVELDAVEISTPHTLHFEQIMARAGQRAARAD